MNSVNTLDSGRTIMQNAHLLETTSLYPNKLVQFVVRYLAVPIILISTILTYYYFVHVYAEHIVLGFMPKEMAAFASASIVLALGLMIFELNFPLE